jgi:hypothetical protein
MLEAQTSRERRNRVNGGLTPPSVTFTTSRFFVKSPHVHLAATHARYTMSMSMSRVLSSDSSEHSTPLSNNKERRGANNAPLVRSLSVPHNVHNKNNNDQLSPPCQPSPIVSRGLISYPMSSFLRNVSCKVPKRSTDHQSNRHIVNVHQTSVPRLSTTATPRR